MLLHSLFPFYESRSLDSKMIRITARTNDKIKYAGKLCLDASERKKSGLFFLEGLRLCCDAVRSGVPICEVFVTDDALSRYGEELRPLLESGNEVYGITEEIAHKLADTKNPQGVFCIAKRLDKFHNMDKINYNGIYIAAENLQTPGNLGAVARTAEALGLDGLIVSGGCDIFNPKAQRAAMGSLLRLPVYEIAELPAFLRECAEKGVATYAAVPDADALPVTQMDRTGGLVCVIGNEGNGLSEEVIRACRSAVTIPMKGRAESLNAAAAASVIMWEMVR